VPAPCAGPPNESPGRGRAGPASARGDNQQEPGNPRQGASARQTECNHRNVRHQCQTEGKHAGTEPGTRGACPPTRRTHKCTGREEAQTPTTQDGSGGRQPRGRSKSGRAGEIPDRAPPPSTPEQAVQSGNWTAEIWHTANTATRSATAGEQGLRQAAAGRPECAADGPCPEHTQDNGGSGRGARNSPRAAAMRAREARRKDHKACKHKTQRCRGRRRSAQCDPNQHGGAPRPRPGKQQGDQRRQQPSLEAEQPSSEPCPRDDPGPGTNKAGAAAAGPAGPRAKRARAPGQGATRTGGTKHRRLARRQQIPRCPRQAGGWPREPKLQRGPHTKRQVVARSNAHPASGTGPTAAPRPRARTAHPSNQRTCQASARPQPTTTTRSREAPCDQERSRGRRGTRANLTDRRRTARTASAKTPQDRGSHPEPRGRQAKPGTSRTAAVAPASRG